MPKILSRESRQATLMSWSQSMQLEQVYQIKILLTQLPVKIEHRMWALPRQICSAALLFGTLGIGAMLSETGPTPIPYHH